MNEALNHLMKEHSLGKLLGVPVYVSNVFLCVASGLTLGALFERTPPTTVLYYLAFFFLLYLSILAHEMGHVRAAARVGLPTKKIVLGVIGGRAEIAAFNRNRPMDEVVVALSGPLVSLVAAFNFTLFWCLSPLELFKHLALANLILVVFNLLPTFPSDGGRILRGLLGTFLDYDVATKIAVYLSLVLCAGLIATGIVIAWYQLIPAALFFAVIALAELPSVENYLEERLT